VTEPLFARNSYQIIPQVFTNLVVMKITVFVVALLVLTTQTIVFAQGTSATLTTGSVMVSSSTTSATQKVKETVKAKPSKALRVFFESRNVVARPEGYETLLTIEETGAIHFAFHTVSGRRDSILAQLKPKELQALRKALNFPKMLAVEPAQRLVYADWMQSLTVEKDEKSKTIRFMVDIQKKTKENVEKHIQEQFGKEMTREVWEFVKLVRSINDRFRF